MRSIAAVLLGCVLSACPAPSGGDAGAGGGVFGGLGGGFGGGPGPTGGGAGGTPLDTFCNFLGGTGGCTAAAGCGLYTDAQQCRTYLQSRTTPFDLCAYARAGIDAGAFLFDAQAAQECMAGYQQCDQSILTCARVLTGAGGNGADCDPTRPCQPGYYCASNGTCPGQCAPRQPGGAEVSWPGACAESTSARYTSRPDGGSFYACEPKVGLGQPCSVTSQCLEPLWCDGATHVCTPPHGEGEPCSLAVEFTTECAQLVRLACQPQADGGTPRCQPRAKRGEACGFCVSDLRCVKDGGSFGVCGALAAQGESCGDSSECASGALTCEGGLCVPVPGEGGACGGSYVCQAGLVCRSQYVDGGLVSRCERFDAGTEPTCTDTGAP